jgi:cellulose synthase/poly-beta-1,6-N-acetylglucosamine synthase-like glycosyltransferase
MLNAVLQIYENLGLMTHVILGIFFYSFIIQFFYYLFFYSRIAFAKKRNNESESNKIPVSIVICARNEEENLKIFLPEVLTQDYPSYEVIVVNDCSEDISAQILYETKQKYQHLYYTNINGDKKFEHGKKLALSIGIKAATNDWMILTDADCIPDSKNWITTMQKKFNEGVEFVLGYSGYFKEKGLLNKIIRFDTAFIAIQYLGFAMAKIPYMGVGRNLAYKKSFFFKVKGFASQLFLMSGDDDLFVNKNATGKNTKVVLDPESFTHSVPSKHWTPWIRQKRRHLSTGRHYRFFHKLLLGLEIVPRMLFYFTFIYLIFQQSIVYYILGLFGFRLILQNLIFYFAFKRLKEIDLLWWVFLFDLILPFINFYVIISRIFVKKSVTWK